MATKTFELPVLISLINGHLFRDVEQADVDDLVTHIHNGEVSVTDPDSVDRAIEFVVQHHPRVVKAAEAVAMCGNALDNARWIKLTDIHRPKHEVASLQVEEVAEEA